MNNTLHEMASSKRAIPCLFYPVVKEMGMSVHDVLTDSMKQKDVLLKIAEEYDVGAVIRMTELWCEAAAFGMDCVMGDADFPRLGSPLFSSIASMDSLVIPAPVNGVTAPLIEAVRLAAPGMKKPLIAGVTGPYTLGSVLNGSEEFMMNCMMEPDAIHEFLEKITVFLIAYALEYKKAGADGVILAEPSVTMISPDMTGEFSNPYIEKIVSEVQDDAFPVIYHNCGAVNSHMKSIAKLSTRAFHFGSDVDLGVALDILPSGRTVMGNMDPRRFITTAPAKIEEKTNALLSRYANHENFICSTGCDLSPIARMDSVSMFCDTVASYRM